MQERQLKAVLILIGLYNQLAKKTIMILKIKIINVSLFKIAKVTIVVNFISSII